MIEDKQQQIIEPKVIKSEKESSNAAELTALESESKPQLHV